jgi:uncharacterized protein
MLLEWDSSKNEKNIKRHKLDFNDALMVFEQPMLSRIDDRENYGEDRWIGLGKLDGAIVVIVYTLRNENVRVISLRRANRRERKIYEERINKPY